MPSSLVAPLVGAGVSLLGGMMDSGGEQQQQSSNAPWAPQDAHIQNVYRSAEGIYNDRLAAGPYKGDTYAHINGIQQGGVDRADWWTKGTGQNLANGTSGVAATLQGGAPAYINNAMSMASGAAGGGNPALTGVLNDYATGATKIGGMDPALSTALSSAATAGVGSINNFNSGLTTAANTAMADPTAGLAQSAGMYANSGYVNDSVNAAHANIQHNLGMQNAQSDQAASNRGGVNSSRAGMQIAMNSEAAARLGAETEASMRGAAYNQGLQTAAGQRTSGLQTATAANIGGINANGNLGATAAGLGQRAGEFDATSRMGAATAGLAQGTDAARLDASTRLGANAQLGTGAGLGVNAADSAMGLAGKNFDLASASGGLYQNDTNAGLTDAYGKWQRDNGYAQSVLDPYAKIAQQGFNGANSTTSSGTSSGPSNLAANVMGGAAMGYGLYDRWQNGSNSGRPNPVNLNNNPIYDSGMQYTPGLMGALY